MADHVAHNHGGMDVRGLTDACRNFTGKTVVVEGGSGGSIPFTQITSADQAQEMCEKKIQRKGHWSLVW